MTQSFVHKYTGNLSTQGYKRKNFKTRQRLALGFKNETTKDELIKLAAQAIREKPNTD